MSGQHNLDGAKPRVFVSSTVRDLGDLRSSVKWWLEEYGFDVFTSESPDFPAPADRRTFEAARSVIRDCQYFVLVVGSRRGSLWPGSDTSVTREEFHHARDLARERGLPGIITFVRRDVINSYRDGGRPTDTPEPEWEHQLSFLRELHDSLGPDDPNWIHAFGTFAEIVQTLRATLRVSGPLARRSLEASLCDEIVQNSRRLLHKSPRGPIPLGALVQSANWLGAVDTTENVPAGEANALAQFYLLKPPVGWLRRLFLHEALTSGLFLEYDPRRQMPHAGPVQSTLLELNTRLDNYERAVEPMTELTTRELLEVMPRQRGGPRAPARISWTAARWYHLTAAELLNALALNWSLYRFFRGFDEALAVPVLRPTLPNAEDAAQIEREWVSAAEATTWLERADLV